MNKFHISAIPDLRVHDICEKMKVQKELYNFNLISQR